jgi:hypothetical protein
VTDISRSKSLRTGRRPASYLEAHANAIQTIATPTPAERPLPKSLPTILYWNAGGITKAKQDEFYRNVHDQDADVFCSREAGKIAEETDVNLRDLATPNYTIHVLERSRLIASGLIVGVRSMLISAFKETHKMQPDKTEIATLDVWLGTKKTAPST